MAHHLTTGHFTKFHGRNRQGAFQTGKTETLRLYSAHHMESNGVISTLQDLFNDSLINSVTLATGTNEITINGVTYDANTDYEQAFIAQRNFDNLLFKIHEVVNVVSVDVQAGIAETVTSLSAEFASLFLGRTAANTFGTELIQDGGFAWQIDIVVEQKGAFANTPGSVGFVRGEPSLPSAANNGGSTLVDVANHLEGTVLYATQSDTAGGDLRVMVDANTTGAFAPGINILTGVAGVFGGAFGDQVTFITQENVTFATSQTVVIELSVAADLQS